MSLTGLQPIPDVEAAGQSSRYDRLGALVVRRRLTVP
jgi:hypothetical protein